MAKSNTKFNYIYSVAYSMLNMLLPLITSPYISRVIGAEGLGVYSYNYSIANYFMIFAMLGINNYGNRNVAKVRDDREKLNIIFSEIYTMQLIMAAIMLGAYLFYAFFCVKENRMIVFVQIFMVLSPAVTLSWFFMGLEQFKITVTRNFVLKLLTFASIFIFVRKSTDLWKYTLIMSLGFFISEGVLVFIIPKYVSLRKVPIKDVIKHIKPNIILFIPVVAVSIYRTMDRIMLKELSSYSQVGFYTNAEKIINICLAFVTALGQVMLPKMANMIANGETDSFYKLIRKSMKFVSMVTVAMCFGIFSVAEEFVPIFFGEGYEPCIRILQLLSVNLFFLGWGNVIKTQYLIPKEKDCIYIKAVFSGVVVNLIINYLLIGKYEAIGATIGTISAEIVSLMVIFITIRGAVSLKEYAIDFVPYLGIGLLMSCLLAVITKIGAYGFTGLVIKIIVGGAFFGACTILYWFFTKDEFWSYFERLLHRH